MHADKWVWIWWFISIHILKKNFHTCRSSCLSSLCQELFCSAYSEQISQFVLPALAYSKDKFPLVDLLHVLVPVCQSMGSGTCQSTSPVYNTQNLPVEPSPWLLYAILTLSEQYIGTYHHYL